MGLPGREPSCYYSFKTLWTIDSEDDNQEGQGQCAKPFQGFQGLQRPSKGREEHSGAFKVLKFGALKGSHEPSQALWGLQRPRGTVGGKSLEAFEEHSKVTQGFHFLFVHQTSEPATICVVVPSQDEYRAATRHAPDCHFFIKVCEEAFETACYGLKTVSLLFRS